MANPPPTAVCFKSHAQIACLKLGWGADMHSPAPLHESNTEVAVWLNIASGALTGNKNGLGRCHWDFLFCAQSNPKALGMQLATLYGAKFTITKIIEFSGILHCPIESG